MRACSPCAPRLRVVGRLGVGLDNIDVDACAARGIDVIPATGANALAVAEYVIATAMLLLRGAYHADGRRRRRALAARRAVQRPRAGRQDARPGRLRRHRAPRREGSARALGMRTIGFDPQVPAHRPVWSDDDTTPRHVRRGGRRGRRRDAARAAHACDAQPDGRGAHRDDEARRDPDQHGARRRRRRSRGGGGVARAAGSAARRSTCSSTSRSAPDRRSPAARI